MRQKYIVSPGCTDQFVVSFLKPYVLFVIYLDWHTFKQIYLERILKNKDPSLMEKYKILIKTHVTLIQKCHSHSMQIYFIILSRSSPTAISGNRYGWFIYPYPEPVVFQWQSSGNPVCLELRPQCTLECHWRNSSVLPVVFQWLSSGLPVCSNYAN